MVKLIIFMDDFEIPLLSYDFPSDFFSLLRGIANNNDVAYVTATTERLIDLFRKKRRPESPFPNIFGTVLVGCFDELTTKAIVANPMEGQISPLGDFFGEIYEIAGGFPLLVHCLCAKLYDVYSANGRLKDDDIKRAAAEVLEECRDALENFYQAFSVEERTVCEKIMRKESVNEFSEAVASLERKGHVRADKKTGGLRLWPALVRRFLRKEMKLQESDSVTRLSILGKLRRRLGKS